MSENLENTRDEYADEKNVRFVRWQAITLEQLSATSNMVLGLGTGLLAVLFTFMVDNKIQASTVGESLRNVLWGLGISICCAVLCAMTRLQDFRGTKEIARRKLRGDTLTKRRACVKRWGKVTWFLLYAQIATFGYGAVASTMMIFEAWQKTPIHEIKSENSVK